LFFRYPKRVEFAATVELEVSTKQKPGSPSSSSSLLSSLKSKSKARRDMENLRRKNGENGAGANGGGQGSTDSEGTPIPSITLGDPIHVKYCYRHNTELRRPHHVLDWIGLFDLSQLTEEEIRLGRVRGKKGKKQQRSMCPKKGLVAWSLVPPGNDGEVVLTDAPAAPGEYALQYCIHGSDCCLGRTVFMHSILVQVRERERKQRASVLELNEVDSC
jgi:hypothetical protein